MKNAKSIESELDDVLGLNSKEDKPVSKTMTKDQELNSILGLSDTAVVEEKKDEVVQEDNNDFEKKKQSLINKLIDMDNNGEALKNAKNASNVEDLKAIIKSFKGEKVALADKVAGLDAFIAKLEKAIKKANDLNDSIQGKDYYDAKKAGYKVETSGSNIRWEGFKKMYKSTVANYVKQIQAVIASAKKAKTAEQLKTVKDNYLKNDKIKIPESPKSAYSKYKNPVKLADTDNQEQTFDELLAGLDAPVAEVEEIKSENEVQGIENLITELETELESNEELNADKTKELQDLVSGLEECITKIYDAKDAIAGFVATEEPASEETAEETASE